MQVCPALDTAPQAAASAAASRSASALTRKASLPPHSATIGVRFSRAGGHDLAGGGAEPVNAILLTALRGQRLAGLGRPGDQLQHRLLRHDLGERADQPAADRGGELAGLEHHGVARGERVGDRAHRGEHRVVPRPDDADDAERLVLDRGGLVDRDEPAAHPARAEHLARVLGRPVDVHDRQDDLQLGVGQRLARLGVHEFGEPPDVPGDVRLPGQQPGLPFLPVQARPPRAAASRPARRRRRPRPPASPGRWRSPRMSPG